MSRINERSGHWTRRDLLRSASATVAASLTPAGLHAMSPATRVLPPFSRFVDVGHAAGLNHVMHFGEETHVTYVIENMGGGCAFIDYDNDGWMDIFLLCGRRLDSVPEGASNRLYHNNRDGTFTDVTEKAGLLRTGWANGLCVGDYNNDGFEDLFITYYGQNVLYRNNGDGTFTDVTEKAGLLHPHIRFGTGCTFVDYNRDGLLDLFVSNYVEFNLDMAPKPSLKTLNCNYEGVAVNCLPRAYTPPGHFLYRNNGDDTFTNVSKESGVAAIRQSYGLSVVAFDADEDGWQDIFVACDSSPSVLLLNNHDGTFREEAMERGVAVSPEGGEIGGMGTGVGDYNLDGHLDLLKTHFINQYTGLYQGNGKADFEDVAARAGIAGEHRFICWGVGFADFDNNGYPDIFVVNGSVYPELEPLFAKYPARGPRLLFRNKGDRSFVQMTDEAGPGISTPHMSRGCAFGDFDNDGDLDILILNINEAPSLLRNDAPPGNHWLKIRLEGTTSNRSAIGARILARYAGKVQAQTVVSQTSYLSANDPRLHFGLGAATTADLEIFWPSGARETYSALAANQIVKIREGTGILPKTVPVPNRTI
jgi:enediyne biosynthesis protein E4